MECPTCGRPLPRGAVFCPGCGSRVPGAVECDEYTYEAFISYRHASRDRAAALLVQRTIEGFRLPPEVGERLGRAQLGRCFRDEDELPASDSLPSLVEDALAHARYLIVVCSPEMRESRWVEREVELFCAYHGRDRVLLTLAAGEPEEAFPPLVVAPDADGQTREPLAADLRGTSRRHRRDEALRFVAAIAGCGYDDLRQRERARRRGRLALAALVAAVVSLAFAGFAIVQQARVQENYEMALVRQSEYLADEADTLLARGDRMQAVQVALDALGDGDRPYVPAARLALERALQVYPSTYWTPVYSNRESSTIAEVVLSADKTLYATLDGNDVVHVYDVQTGRAVCQIEPASLPDEITGIEEQASRQDCLFAGERVVCLEDYHWVVGYDARTGEELYRVDPDTGFCEDLVVSADEKVMALTASPGLDQAPCTVLLDPVTGEVLSKSDLPTDAKLDGEYDFSSNPAALSADGSVLFQAFPNALGSLDRASGTWSVVGADFGVAVDVLVERDALYVTWFDENEDQSSVVIAAYDPRSLACRWSQRFAATSRDPSITVEPPTLVEVADSEIGRDLLVVMDTHLMLLDVSDGSIDLDKETTGVISTAHVVSDALIAYVSDGHLNLTGIAASSNHGITYLGDSMSSPYTLGEGPDTEAEGVTIFANDGKGYCLLEDTGEGRTLLYQLDFQMDLPGRRDLEAGADGLFIRTANGEYVLSYDWDDCAISVLSGTTFDVLGALDLASMFPTGDDGSTYYHVALSSDCDELLYVESGGTLYAVDVTTGEKLGSLDGVGGVLDGMNYGIDTFDGQVALVVKGDATESGERGFELIVADARTLEVRARVSLVTAGEKYISDINEWCLFGGYLVTVERDDNLNGVVRVFDASSGERVACALDGVTIARTTGELAGHFVESGTSAPNGDARHYLTFDRERSVMAVSDVKSGTVMVFDQHLEPVWEALGDDVTLDDVTFLMFLPSGDLLVQGRTSLDGMGQYLLVDGETGGIVATSNEASLVERGWIGQDGTTLFAQTQSYAIGKLNRSFVTGIVTISLDPDSFGEQSQIDCAEAVSLDESRVLCYDQIWDAAFTLPLYTTDELVSKAHELVSGHELSDVERLLYHLE